jgi:LmbE family N-acetylglucosaminyl deacetylase
MAGAVVVFAPHPDDETLACGGTIAGEVRRGRDVHIVFMTDGGRSQSERWGTAFARAPENVARVRRREAEAAASVLGVAARNLVFLGFESLALVDEYEAVCAEVRAVLADLEPGEVYYPDRADSHRTHRATHDIVESCLGAIEFSGDRRRYVVWPDEEGNRAGKGEVIQVDVRDTLAVKTKALGEYRSQVAPFPRRPRQPVLSRSFLAHFLTSREVFYC